ncbi:MAG: ATP-binding cassette domain-containing protein [Eubacteriales bacterium]|nr:ATP-binding cassette domain-containing protein [Eubacteriales bacterium]
MPFCLEEVSFTYAAGTPLAVQALRGVSLRMEAGEVLGVMGHTGCGKSTLIQLLAGLLVPTHGRVLLDGQDINAPGCDRAALRARVGLVFQYPECQLFEITVAKDVTFGLKHSGLSPAQKEERVRAALETVGFSYERMGAQSPLALSGGEKRRVAIAGVLAARPEILIFDEPIAGLDPMGRERFLALVRRLNAQGTSIVLVSHNADALAQCADRLLVLKDGCVALEGTAEQVFADVEAARRLQVDVSTPRALGQMLTQRGVAVPAGAVTYEGLLSVLKERFCAGGNP